MPVLEQPVSRYNLTIKLTLSHLTSGCRFVMGSNKLIQVALGKSTADEYKPNLSQLSQRLKGNVGLFFTQLPKEEVSRCAFLATWPVGHCPCPCQACRCCTCIAPGCTPLGQRSKERCMFASRSAQHLQVDALLRMGGYEHAVDACTCQHARRCSNCLTPIITRTTHEQAHVRQKTSPC